MSERLHTYTDKGQNAGKNGDTLQTLQTYVFDVVTYSSTQPMTLFLKLSCVCIEHERVCRDCSIFFPSRLRLSLRVSSSINTSGIFSPLSPCLLLWERRGQRGEAQAPVKWLYRGETRAGRGPRLKAEWQAAEAIKIEPLSLAARALLMHAGAQAALRTVAHTHLLSCGT